MASYALSLCNSETAVDVRDSNSKTFQLGELLRADLTPYIHELIEQQEQLEALASSGNQGTNQIPDMNSSNSFEDFSLSRNYCEGAH